MIETQLARNQPAPALSALALRPAGDALSSLRITPNYAFFDRRCSALPPLSLTALVCYRKRQPKSVCTSLHYFALLCTTLQ